MSNEPAGAPDSKGTAGLQCYVRGLCTIAWQVVIAVKGLSWTTPLTSSCESSQQAYVTFILLIVWESPRYIDDLPLSHVRLG